MHLHNLKQIKSQEHAVCPYNHSKRWGAPPAGFCNYVLGPPGGRPNPQQSTMSGRPPNRALLQTQGWVLARLTLDRRRHKRPPAESRSECSGSAEASCRPPDVVLVKVCIGVFFRCFGWLEVVDVRGLAGGFGGPQQPLQKVGGLAPPLSGMILGLSDLRSRPRPRTIDDLRPAPEPHIITNPSVGAQPRHFPLPWTGSGSGPKTADREPKAEYG